jgi:hypothetical protein
VIHLGQYAVVTGNPSPSLQPYFDRDKGLDQASAASSCSLARPTRALASHRKGVVPVSAVNLHQKGRWDMPA